MSSKQPDELDQLLDAALAGYAGEEPRPGLEQRVLSRVQTADSPRRWGWWLWAAVPGLAALAMLAMHFRVNPQPVSVAKEMVRAQQTEASVETSAPPKPAAVGRLPRVAHRPVVAHTPVPRRGVFPVPSPLSAEERALVVLVTRFPEQARESLAAAEQRGIEPIEIPKIEIPPLTGGGNEQK